MVNPVHELARWITAPGPDPQNPLFRISFHLDSQPMTARLLVTGLGVFRSFVNGAPAPISRLDPGLTDVRTRVPVCEVEVTELLGHGENVLGIALGRGFYNMTTPNVWRWEKAPWRGPTRAWAHLEMNFADGSTRSITTGEDWRTHPGPVTADSMYEGETFAPTEDPQAWLLPGYSDAKWVDAISAPNVFNPQLEHQIQEPVVVVERITPRVVTSTSNRIVLDLGKVVAGWSHYELDPSVHQKAGPVEIIARHGEKLRADGTVDNDNIHVRADRFQEDRVRLEPAFARSFEPQYTYKGFRYVQLDAVTGDLKSVRVTGILAHADLTSSSTLTSSCKYLEQFDAAMRASLLNNMHHVPTDTPMHEKNGWTGDALTSLTTMFNSFDMRNMLNKWLLDQIDGQRADGSLPVISPSPGWGYDELSPAPEWTTLLPVLIDELATEYGETNLVTLHGRAAASYLNYELGRRDGDGLISSVLGDYLSPGTQGPAREDKRLTGTLYVARALRALAHAIEITETDGPSHQLPSGNRGDTAQAQDRALSMPTPRELHEEASSLEAAVNSQFLDTQRGLYTAGNNSEYRQTSNAVPLAFGIVPDDQIERVAENLIADVKRRGDHHDCGHIGVRYLLPVLSEHGHGDLALRVLTNRTAPGWRSWLESGNSTFMEMWQNPRSCSHYFMGTPAAWIQENVAGLRRGLGGWKSFIVAPDINVPVEQIAIARETIYGKIQLDVNRERREIHLNLPNDTQAHLILPGVDELVTSGRHTVTW